MLIATLHRASQAAEAHCAEVLRPLETTPRQVTVLQAIAEHKEPCQTTLVVATGIDRSTLADMLRRLERRGQISRTRARTDARANIVRLTRAGRQCLDAALSRIERIDIELMARPGMSNAVKALSGLEAP